MDRLQADSIIKHYGPLRVLSDIYISCSRGEVVGLIGRNGCGKSTLMKIIFGSLAADQKYVSVNNRQLTSLAESIRLIRYLPQDNFLPGNTRLIELIGLFDGSFDTRGFLADPLVSELLNCKPNQMSGGERRIAEILMILYSGSGYLLLDEPFNGVAPIHKEAIKELIRKKAAGAGILISDHDYRNVLDVSDRLLMIYDGGIKTIADENELMFWGYLPENDQVK